MALWAIPKKDMIETSGGVVLNVDWFDSDPSEDRDLRPIRVDQILLLAPTIDRVTDADIAEALERREVEVEREIRPPDNQPPAKVRAMLGKARRVEGRRS